MNKLKSQTLYNFFLHLFIVITILSTTNVYAKVYKVRDIQIIEPYNKNFKKNIIINKAFISAFEILLKRIVISEDFQKVLTKKSDSIKPMIDSFLIVDEKFSNDNYMAMFEVNFDKNKVLQYINSKKVISSIPKESMIFFYPVLININKDELYMFDENYFYKEWNINKKPTYLLNYNLPSEDIEDFNIIKKNISNIENFKFEQVLLKYKKSDYILAIFFTNGKEFKVLSKISYNDKMTIIKSEFENYKNKQKIIFDLKKIYENEWKKQNQINTSIKLSLTVSLKSKDLNLINKFESELQKSELVYNYRIHRINSENTIYKIVYHGTPDQFIENLKIQNFQVDISQEIWKVSL